VSNDGNAALKICITAYRQLLGKPHTCLIPCRHYSHWQSAEGATTHSYKGSNNSSFNFNTIVSLFTSVKLFIS